MEYTIKINEGSKEGLLTTVHSSIHLGEMINQIKANIKDVKSIEIIMHS